MITEGDIVGGFVCLIQKGQTAHTIMPELEYGLQELGRAHLGDREPAKVTWHPIEDGSMFTGGRPSTSSIIVRTAPADMSLSAREAFMHGICKLWTSTTRCAADEIIVALTAGPPQIGHLPVGRTGGYDA